MDDISFKDIRVLPSSLDLKNNAGKTLAEILGQLQSGATLKGLVVGKTPKGDVIFHTAYGRFIAPNKLDLSRGDTITLRLSVATDQLSGTIVTVNNERLKSKTPMQVDFVKQQGETERKLNTKSLESPVNIRNSGDIPKTISGQISYLNLSKINQSSQLFNLLNNPNLTGKIPITLNIITSQQSAFVVNGQVSDNPPAGQLIKTNFGVITIPNSRMPIGQNLTLEVTSINNQLIETNISKNVSDFIFALNKNWQLISSLSLTPVFANIKTKESKVNKDSPTSKEPMQAKPEIQSLNSIIKSLGNHESVKRLSTEFQNIKELLVSSAIEDHELGKWQTVMIPFYNGQKVEDHMVKFDRSKKNFLRFIIDINLHENPMQVDGLVQFENGNKTPKGFDLTLRAKDKIDPNLQKKIFDIFNTNQDITGVRGTFSIEGFSN